MLVYHGALFLTSMLVRYNIRHPVIESAGKTEPEQNPTRYWLQYSMVLSAAAGIT